MHLVRFSAAFLVLVLLSLFIQSNILQTEQNSGTFGLSYLYSAIAAFTVALVLSGDVSSLLKLKKPTLLLAAFLVYALAKFYLEADSEQIRQVTLGSTQGLIFSLVVGISASYAIFTLYNVYSYQQLTLIVTLCCLGYLFFVSFSTYGLFQEGLSNVRAEIFRVDDDIQYQRPADLLILQLLIATSVSLIVLIGNPTHKFPKFVLVTPLILALAAATGLLTQLFGSNKGALASIGVTLIFFVASVNALVSRPDQSIKSTDFLFGRLGRYVVLGLLTGIVLAAGAAFGAVEYFKIDITQMRLFGYGLELDGLRSVTSRTEIFRDNFVKHFEYSPIFGHTQVEKIFGDYGRYVHSTLSILTHLGLVGFILFLFLLFSMYREITRGNENHRADSLSNNALYGVLRLLLFSFILAMGLYSAFFTWMPLWFSIGFFGSWFTFNSNHRNKLSKSKPRRRKRKRRTSSIAER